ATIETLLNNATRWCHSICQRVALAKTVPDSDGKQAVSQQLAATGGKARRRWQWQRAAPRRRVGKERNIIKVTVSARRSESNFQMQTLHSTESRLSFSQ